MGAIFSGAREVISWLGVESLIKDFLRHDHTHGGMVPHLATVFNYNDYWTRAWITQEVLLAQHVRLMAGEIELTMDSLPIYIMNTGSNVLIQARGPVAAFTSNAGSSISASPDGIDVTRPMHKIGGSSLFFLPSEFKDQRCEIPRDRVFSLLALFKDGAGIRVNYEVSDAELAYSLLKGCELSVCFCAVRIVGSVFPSRLTTSPFPPATYIDIKLRRVELSWIGPKDLEAYLDIETYFDPSVNSPQRRIFDQCQRSCEGLRLQAQALGLYSQEILFVFIRCSVTCAESPETMVFLVYPNQHVLYTIAQSTSFDMAQERLDAFEQQGWHATESTAVGSTRAIADIVDSRSCGNTDDAELKVISGSLRLRLSLNFLFNLTTKSAWRVSKTCCKRGRGEIKRIEGVSRSCNKGRRESERNVFNLQRD
jgi:hypothetical protein